MGFRPGDSTTNQLLHIVHKIHYSFDHKQSREVRSIFLDISKAFDKVWHEGLIYKLEQNGISGHLLSLMSNYLTNRKQRVLLNGSVSGWGLIEAGVPQGSVLGPLLFLIYINDLEKGIKSEVKFFADDTSLFSIVSDPVITAAQINHDLQLIEQWAYQWKMSFNPDPNKQAIELLFSQKKKNINHPPLFFNQKQVVSVTVHKHLGLTLDSKLLFIKHITEKISKARKGIGVIRYLSSYVPLSTLDQVFKMFVRPHLDYCDVIFHIPQQNNQFDSSINLNLLMNSLESTQYHAALAVSGAWKGTNTSKLYEELGWESLSDRRWMRRLLHFYKIFNNLTPSYLKDIITMTRPLLYGIRRENVLNQFVCRTSKFQNSFFPDSTRCWNNIGFEFRSVISIGLFKNKLLSLIRPLKKSVFNLHNPMGIKILFRLRMGLSELKAHKNAHHFIDTPFAICECGVEPEDSMHFFFNCVQFAAHRISLVDTISNILSKNNLLHFSHADRLKVYLYGHFKLTSNENKCILEATIKYIYETKRFLT